MNIRVVLRAAKGTGQTEVVQCRLTCKVGLKIIPQVIKVVLTHDFSFDDGRRGAREVKPANIASYTV